uniref:Protein kinase domain-containing protein n=1 Tax=Angiostrongylus cantonensis TaxID=6313 RepID=A0A0K0D342_ANGCA
MGRRISISQVNANGVRNIVGMAEYECEASPSHDIMRRVCEAKDYDSSEEFVVGRRQEDWVIVADIVFALLEQQCGLARLPRSRNLALRQVFKTMLSGLVLFDFSSTKQHVGYQKREAVARHIHPRLFYIK